jgi:hypothetical protein
VSLYYVNCAVYDKLFDNWCCRYQSVLTIVELLIDFSKHSVMDVDTSLKFL